MVISARTPAEQVYPAAVGRGNVPIQIADVIKLVSGKAPCIGGSLVLQVTLREPYLLRGTYGEEACNRTLRTCDREAPLVAIDCACSRGGVGPHIIGGT